MRRTNAKTYFEVGVYEGSNIAKIHVDTAIGVDPNFVLTANVASGKRAVHLFQQTSDDFFESSTASCWKGKIDFTFLDGMHLFEFLLRDFFNVERLCHNKSTIVMHDCLPFNGAMAERDHRPKRRTDMYPGAWTGDVWKLVPILRKYRPDLELRLLDCYPTGLVWVSRLDPGSTALQTEYENIVSEFAALPNDEDALVRFYAETGIVSAERMLAQIGAV